MREGEAREPLEPSKGARDAGGRGGHLRGPYRLNDAKVLEAEEHWCGRVGRNQLGAPFG